MHDFLFFCFTLQRYDKKANPISLPPASLFPAGAMMYVVIEELIPESQNGEHSNIGTIGAAVGFALMMVLDIALG
jgi:ZIP family zinc transporter